MMIGGTMYFKGDVVVVQFPFSDMLHAKKRPMVILAMRGKDILGCAVTSNLESEGIPLTEFAEGSLPLESKVKYWQVNTVLGELVVRKIAKISKRTHQELVGKINELIKV